MTVLDTLLDGPLVENKQGTSLVKASTPEPFSASRTSNWVARAGGLPSYIQHIAHDLMEKRGKSESEAIQMAVGIVKNWASGRGNVDANTRAAATKAVAEWEAKRGKGRAAGAAKAAVQHAEPSVSDGLALADVAEARLFGLARALDVEALQVLVEAESGSDLKVKCPKCDTVNAASAKSCKSCGHDLSKARGAKFAKMQEAAKPGGWKPELKRAASANGEVSRHEVHDGGQHVGTIARRPSYGRGEPDRFSVHAINGQEIRDVGIKSQADAVETLRKHLEEAPSRIMAAGGKHLVAQPKSYSGRTSYEEAPSMPVARHMAGLPENPTAPEQSAAAAQLAERAQVDAALIASFAPNRYAEVWGPLLEGGRSLPFDGALVEAFSTALHPHGYHGHFTETGGRARAAVAALSRRVNTSPRLPVRPDSRNADRGRFRGPKLSEKQMVEQTRHGVWEAGARGVADSLRKGLAKDTESAHRAQLPNGKLGPYSHERAQLHAAIIRALLQGVGSHSNAEAHFMAGGPASGKSHLLKTGAVKLPKDHAVINPDIVKEMLPEYRALRDAKDPAAAQKVHEESSHVAQLATNIALHQQMHTVVDTVGNSEPGKFARKLRNAQAAGHTVHVHYASNPVDQALARAEARRVKTGRGVPDAYLRSAHRSVSQIFHGDVRQMPGVHITVHDTGGRPKLVAQKGARGSLRVVHAKGYARFLAKGGIGA